MDQPNINSDKENKSELFDITNKIEENVNKSSQVDLEDFNKPKEKSSAGVWIKEILLFLADFALNFVIIVGLVFLIRVYVIAPFQVSGASMCDTLNFINNECNSGAGEYLIVNKLFYKKIFDYQIRAPQRGDIIVFKPPLKGNNDYFIKRIIGLPGEKIKIQNGEVYVYNDSHPQGFKLKEDYLNVINNHNTLVYSRGFSEFKVPEGHYLALGDNRKASSDSRHCFNPKGCTGDATPYVPLENIEGDAFVTLWPFSNIKLFRQYNYEE